MHGEAKWEQNRWHKCRGGIIVGGKTGPSTGGSGAKGWQVKAKDNGTRVKSSVQALALHSNLKKIAKYINKEFMHKK